MFYNLSLPAPVVIVLIVVVVLQYAFALFCLLKLAYLDIPKKQYVLWNLLILLVFFIGATIFLVYYSKVKDTKRIVLTDDTNELQTQQTGDADAQSENSETPEEVEKPENADKPEAAEKTENSEKCDDTANDE